MSNRLALGTLFTAAALAATVLAAAEPASAQCRRGGIFCAQVSVGVGVSGGIVIGAPPPPPVVVYQPAPPPVVVYEAAPPPPAVVYQPAPVVVARPMPVVVQPARRQFGIGLHGHIGGMLSERVQMGGGTFALRLRPGPNFAVDLGIGSYAGIDYNDNDRVEVPLTADAIWFLNGQAPLQPYLLAGLGASFARVNDYVGTLTVLPEDRGYVYFGGELGVGAEWRLTQNWALNGDVRGFIRQRASDGSDPEYVERDASGAPTGRTTDTSWGALLTVGATLYF